VPAPGPGVCLICCGPTGTDHAHCFACGWVARRLGAPLAPVFPVRLCPLPGPLYRVLLGYKESPVAEARARFTPMVRLLFEGFLADHADCLTAAAGGPLDHVLAVPSTARPGGSPLHRVEGLAASAAGRTGGRWSPQLLTRAARPLGHMQPDRAGFAVAAASAGALLGTRVLLLDDTYVSGARAQSAAAELRRAGARSVVIAVLGRVLRTDRVALPPGFLAAARADGVPDRQRPCCRCVQTGATTE
jgi:hypothetical protein